MAPLPHHPGMEFRSITILKKLCINRTSSGKPADHSLHVCDKFIVPILKTVITLKFKTGGFAME